MSSILAVSMNFGRPVDELLVEWDILHFSVSVLSGVWGQSLDPCGDVMLPFA
jgi:hypothetical protein